MAKDAGDPDAWKKYFEPGPSGGRVCSLCRCLVRSTDGDAKAHIRWHDSLKAR